MKVVTWKNASGGVSFFFDETHEFVQDDELRNCSYVTTVWVKSASSKQCPKINEPNDSIRTPSNNPCSVTGPATLIAEMTSDGKVKEWRMAWIGAAGGFRV